MDDNPAASSRGFDIYPLVYNMQHRRVWHQRRPDRAYGASVVICREGEKPTDLVSRVFRVPDENWTEMGAAKRAAVRRGEDIIAGLVPDASLAGI
ncbi:MULTISPECIES: hypothetical protein [Burkholderiaceae]|uniref:hypothetical protein n=1 Tax=Burkholderiaceae TaxID=119060 RepID=UPI000490AFCD|nr:MULTISPECIES: hypothetical protein [Burkholderiaceae]